MESPGPFQLSDLPSRLRRVLMAVLEEYIETARPVASRAVVRRAELGISSATARGAMGELAELDLLAQPHTSSGRIPTDTAFRLYVDELMHRVEAEPAGWGAQAPVAPESGADLVELMRDAAEELSLATGQIGFFFGSPADRLVIRQLHFVRVSRETVMAMLVSTTGVVQHRLIEESESDTRTLERVSARLGELVSGLTLAAARARLASRIEADLALGDALWRKTIELGRAGFSRSAETEMQVGSRRQALLAQPEFADVEALRELLAALDERETMVRLLERMLRADAINVAIGTDLEDLHVTGCAVVGASLGTLPPAIGLGVIGPVRMRYDRVIPAVRRVSRRVGDYFS